MSFHWNDIPNYTDRATTDKLKKLWLKSARSALREYGSVQIAIMMANKTVSQSIASAAPRGN